MDGCRVRGFMWFSSSKENRSGIRPERRTRPPPPPSSVMTTPTLSPPPNLEGTENAGNSENDHQGQGYLLPLPPAMKSWHSMSHSLSNINRLPRSSSVHKMKSSLSSTAILRSMSVRKSVTRNNDDDMESVEQRTGQVVETEEKTGETKAGRLVIDEDDHIRGEMQIPEDDEAVFYDNKGKRIPSFRP